MLKHIPKSLVPDLFRAMLAMGHGEELLLCDANYPCGSASAAPIYVTNCTIDELLGDILYYFPLDGSVESAATVMESCRDSGRFEVYRRLVEENGSQLATADRFRFYELAAHASALVMTTDTVRGGNILLKKGVVTGAAEGSEGQ